MKVASLFDVLQEELRDLYSAENQIIKALPKLVKHTTSEQLKEAFNSHLDITKGQVKRLEKAGQILDCKLTGKNCEAMKGLVEEADSIVKEGTAGPMLDALLIGAAQRVEHYEISGYGTARSIAEALGFDDVADLLQETLDEESEADDRLSAISEEEVLPACLEAEAESEQEEEEAAPPSGKQRRGSSSAHSER